MSSANCARRSKSGAGARRDPACSTASGQRAGGGSGGVGDLTLFTKWGFGVRHYSFISLPLFIALYGLFWFRDFSGL